MNDLDADFLAVIVAPFTGAWIEIQCLQDRFAGT